MYSTSFRWKGKPKADRRVYLDLGEVGNLGTVYVNGVNCGTVWTPPYRVEISKALQKGANKLEIEVTNTWANALQGVDEGKAPFPGIWTNANYRKQDKTLLPAGLFGPLKLTQEK